jgi:hypothetical protein
MNGELLQHTVAFSETALWPTENNLQLLPILERY